MSTASTLRASVTPTVAPASATAVMVLTPAGPDVLRHAANLLPEVVGMVSPVCSGSVHRALFEALCRLGVGADRYHRLRLADEARDMFAVYLVATVRAAPEPRVSATMRGWVVFQDTTGVQVALADAAHYWRGQLEWSTPWDAEGDGQRCG